MRPLSYRIFAHLPTVRTGASMTTYEIVMLVAASVTALATVSLAGFAFTAFRASVAQLKLLTADSARQTEDSARQIRPYVNVDVVPGLHGPGTWDLTIENLGQSTAKNIKFDAGTITPQHDKDGYAYPLASFLAHPLDLPPRSRRRVMWRRDPQKDRPGDGAPDRVKLAVAYDDDRTGNYSADFDLSSDVYGAASPAPTEGSEVAGTTSIPPEKSLKNIDHALRALNTHVGMLRY